MVQPEPKIWQHLAAAFGELIAKGKKGFVKASLAAQLTQLEAKVNAKLSVATGAASGASGASGAGGQIPAATAALFERLRKQCAEAYP